MDALDALVQVEKTKRSINHLAGMIPRPIVINTLRDIFSSETHVVFIEGEEGGGASTVMRQFALSDDAPCFEVFLNPVSRVSYSLDYVRLLLSEQIREAIGGSSPAKDVVDEGEFNQLLLKLRSKMRGKVAFFLIDGLSYIPADDELDMRQLFSEVFPIGVDCYRFLIVGRQEQFAKYLRGAPSKPYQLPRFLPEESAQIFAEFSLSQEELQEIHRVCRGNPARLSSIRRLLMAGRSLGEITNNTDNSSLDFIKKEFEVVSRLPMGATDILSVITFSRQILKKAQIQSICQADEQAIDDIVSSCTFLYESDGVVEFISNAHRRYAESLFADRQQGATDLLIEHLVKEPQSEAALLFLPAYYQQKKNHRELINLLSPDHYKGLLESTESMLQLRQRAELGIKSARALDEAIATFQFSLQKALFIDLSRVETPSGEIEALIAMRKADRALSLASQAITKESRLALLTAYAAGMSRENLPVDLEVMSRIRELADCIDFSEGGERFLKLTEDLICVDPSLAADVFEKSLRSVSDDSKRDMALMRFTLAAGIERGGVGGDEAPDNLKFKNEVVSRFASSLATYFKDHDASEIIKVAEEFSPVKRIQFIRSFLKGQGERKGLLELIAFGLDQIVRSSAYNPKAKDYADIVAPLRFQVEPLDRIESLVARFDVQVGLIQDRAVSRDYVKLAISLAYAEFLYNPAAAYKRIVDSYFDVSALSGDDAKAECYANLMMALTDLDPQDEFEEVEGLKYVIGEELSLTIDNLLRHTASQFRCVQSILPVVAKYDINRALAIVERLNTRTNRDKARALLAKEVVANHEYSEASKEALWELLDNISDPSYRGLIVVECCGLLKESMSGEGWAHCLQEAVGQLEVLLWRVSGLSLIVDSSVGRGDIVAELKCLVERLSSDVSPTDERNDVCFQALAVIAKHDIGFSEKVYSELVRQRQAVEADDQKVQDTFVHCLALVSRSIGVGLERKVVDGDMLARLIAAINRLACVKKKVALFGDLAVRCWIANRSDIAREVVNEHCRPELDIARLSDRSLYGVLLVNCFSALYVSHSASALEYLKNYSEIEKDYALYHACMVLRRKLSPLDPVVQWESSSAYKVSYDEILDILMLAERIDYDCLLYDVMRETTDAILSRVNRSCFTVNQRKDIGEKILRIVESKLPDTKNIRHDGYKILGKAKAYILLDERKEVWLRLTRDAEEIDNLSDRVYVFVLLSEDIPAKFSDLSSGCLEKAEALCQEIPSLTDRLSRLTTLAKRVGKADSAGAKSIIRNGFALTQDLTEVDDAISVQKAFINAADQIEPGFADKLIDLLDDDPARREAREQAVREVETLKTKKKMADADDEAFIEGVDLKLFPEAAWRNLGAILADRIESKPLDVMSGYVVAAASLGLYGVYPALCWFIENAGKKFVSTNDAKSKLLPICETLLVSTELAYSIVGMWHKRDNTAVDSSDSGLFVRRDQREDALAYIQCWIDANCIDYIKICDPYFGPEDLYILKMIRSNTSVRHVSILTCMKSGLSHEEFVSAWRRISDQSPPDTSVMAVYEDGAARKPIHDRWLVTKSSGLRLGTSFNSLGNRLSEISIMRDGERANCEEELEKFFARQAFIDGVRVKSLAFDL